MLKNISLGIYYPGNSFIHRLQARTKLLILCCVFSALLIANQRQWHFAPYVAVAALALAGIVLARLSPRDMWRRLWFLLAITVTGALLSIFGSQGDPTVFVNIGPVSTSYALVRTIFLVGGLVLFLLWLSSLLPVLRPFWGRRWARVLKAIILLALCAFLFFFWFTSGVAGTQPLPIGPFIITRGSIWALTTTFAVLLVLYILSLLLTITTMPVALIEGMSMLLAPLRRIKLPVDDFALMSLIALRFIPTLFDEVEQLIKAQTARGADLMHGTLRERIQSLSMFFLPLMQATLRRASELSAALEARGYRTEGRQTRLHETSFAGIDYLAFAIVVVVLVGSLLL
jgi:energy-coupling factor transport system permease protein